ncbi:MAG: 50S ribosomal protein L15 [Sphaerochaetaceae bacterium]|nr:50S ribosomal protein L15 [Sphaerochaetaceae bacterium]
MAQIHAPEGANTKKTIVGRGASSKGRASGRGHDGQNSRSGGGVRLGFEGGQMPLYRKLARRGFTNGPFKKEFAVVSLSTLSEKFEEGQIVNLASLKEKKIVKGKDVQVKVLANGELKKKLVVEGLKVSAPAAEIIKAAGGEVR